MSYATRLIPTLERLAADLTAGGVAASLDRGKLQIPGAWVTPRTADQLTLSGAGTVTASVLLVVAASGDQQALESLAELLDDALAALYGAATVYELPEPVDTSVILPINNNPLPAFRLVVTTELEE